MQVTTLYLVTSAEFIKSKWKRILLIELNTNFSIKQIKYEVIRND